MILCIDMQNDFSNGTLWDVPRIRDIVPPIKALIEAFPDEVLFTRWVNPETGHFAAYKLCLPGTPGVEVLPELLGYARAEITYDKYTYSCFSNQELMDYLRRKGVKKLYLTGVVTDCCVLATAFSAMDEGFDVFMVEDCLASSDPAFHDAALAIVNQRRPGSIITSADLLEKREPALRTWQGGA